MTDTMPPTNGQPRRERHQASYWFITDHVIDQSEDSGREHHAQAERRRLYNWAVAVTLYLVVVSVVSMAAVVWLMDQISDDTNPSGTISVKEFSNTDVILLIIALGTLGSAISALVSVADRFGTGVEYESGTKYPPPEVLEPGKPDQRSMFVKRMIPWFFVRPLLGATAGLLTYLGVIGGYFVAVANPEDVDVRLYSVIFFSLLGGLFAKTLLEKLKDTFDHLVGAGK